VSLDCGGKTTGYSVYSVAASVAAVFYDAGREGRSSDAGTLLGSVGAAFEGGFFVAASFDAGSDATQSSADASDSGLEPDAPEFVVAANIAPREDDDGSSHG